VKPEQASKVKMRMLTRRRNGEGSMDREAIDASTDPVRRGSGHGTREGDAGNRGDPSWRG